MLLLLAKKTNQGDITVVQPALPPASRSPGFIPATIPLQRTKQWLSYGCKCHGTSKFLGRYRRGSTIGGAKTQVTILAPLAKKTNKGYHKRPNGTPPASPGSGFIHASIPLRPKLQCPCFLCRGHRPCKFLSRYMRGIV